MTMPMKKGLYTLTGKLLEIADEKYPRKLEVVDGRSLVKTVLLTSDHFSSLKH